MVNVNKFTCNEAIYSRAVLEWKQTWRKHTNAHCDASKAILFWNLKTEKSKKYQTWIVSVHARIDQQHIDNAVANQLHKNNDDDGDNKQ